MRHSAGQKQSYTDSMSKQEQCLFYFSGLLNWMHLEQQRAIDFDCNAYCRLCNIQNVYAVSWNGSALQSVVAAMVSDDRDPNKNKQTNKHKHT